MDWNHIEANWKQFKGKIQEKWGKFTDDELDVIRGNRQKLEGEIQDKYGVSNDEAKRLLDAFYSSQNF